MHWGENADRPWCRALTHKLLALEALLQPLGRHDVLHHRDGRQELHGARHSAGDQVGALLRRLGHLTAQDVELLHTRGGKGGSAGRHTAARQRT